MKEGTEFWNKTLTQASWEKLQELTLELDFILIGGWAVYLWTGMHKSKDIDVVVDYEVLSKLKKKYPVEKNERLKKYEIKMGKFDIDVYVPFFSKLALPTEELEGLSRSVQGIKTVTPEVILILKQGAEIARRNTVKGEKDTIDILTLLTSAEINLKKYARLLQKHDKQEFRGELETVVRNFSDENIKYLDMDFNEYKNWKKDFLKELKKLNVEKE